MFIEFKDLKKKRNIAFISIILLCMGLIHLMINSKGNIQRVESVIYTDQTIYEKFGKIEDYSIRGAGDRGYNRDKQLIYSYKVDIFGEKNKGVIEFDMHKDQKQQKYLYILKIRKIGSTSWRIRIGKS